MNNGIREEPALGAVITAELRPSTSRTELGKVESILSPALNKFEIALPVESSPEIVIKFPGNVKLIKSADIAVFKPATLYNPSAMVNVFTPAGAALVVSLSLLLLKLAEMLKTVFQMLADVMAAEHSTAFHGILSGSFRVISNDDKSAEIFCAPAFASELNTSDTLFLIRDIATKLLTSIQRPT